MSIIRKLLGACVLVASLGGVSSLWAADNINLPNLGTTQKTKAGFAQEALKKDAVCTRCHDETEPAPVLSIYQTKHGVRGDVRSPTCQSCHGDSDKHVKGDPNVKGRPAPDVVFKKGSYPRTGDDQRTAQCMSCHKNSVQHNNWSGSQHQTNGVACNDCHDGFGLVSMRERALSLGGQFRIASRPGTGTMVEVTLPDGSQCGREETA